MRTSMTSKSIPSTLPKDVRRDVPYGRQAGACSLKTELFTDNPLGEWREGWLRIPKRLVRAQPNTNKKHEFDRMVREQLSLWQDWLGKRGWKLASKPKVSGPFDPPTRTVGEEPTEDEGIVIYSAMARWKQTRRIWVPFDDLLEMNRKAELYGEKPSADPLPWNDVRGGESGWFDPMKEAEEERQRLGVKRSDYLSGPLSEPLLKEKFS